ncbi:hypothetical protein CC2G_010362 [Coprinopsis cinerea AmutBmut pab1-1]|nr:hypothetical protein CC2G_010362 [Coprinopsis cinerea AmutBmut pab1-1]
MPFFMTTRRRRAPMARATPMAPRHRGGLLSSFKPRRTHVAMAPRPRTRRPMRRSRRTTRSKVGILTRIKRVLGLSSSRPGTYVGTRPAAVY